MFSQRYKLALLFSFLFVFLLISIPQPTSSAPLEGYCFCLINGEERDSGVACIEGEDCISACEGILGPPEAEALESARCELLPTPTPPTPPTAPAKEAPVNIVTRAAPTCAPTAECLANWQEAKGGFLKNLSKECYCCGDCGLNDVVNLFIGAANYLFGIVGALALLFFIYGGVLWLTAAGKSEQIEKGKKVLIGAVIGLAIVFGAWLIVQFVMTALGVQSVFVNQFLKTR